MSEPAKFALNDKLWRNLSSQYLEDSLLCSSPQDAVKWLLVSKDIKEVIEENRDKMRRFEGHDIQLFMDDDDAIRLLSASFDVNNSLTVHCGSMIAVRKPTSPILERRRQPYFGNLLWYLVDISPAGIARFIKRAVDWFTIDIAAFDCGLTDLGLFRPLANESNVLIGFYGTYEHDDEVMDAIESLHIQNVGFPRGPHSESFLHRLQGTSLKTVFLSDPELLDHLDCSSIQNNLLAPAVDIQKFVDAIVVPWFNGERPRLKEVCVRLAGEFQCPLFDTVDFVPTELEAEHNRRVFLLMDKKKENIMQVNAGVVPFHFVEVRIASLV